ncbi:MAG: sugar transferase related protein [uncultured bacterium]|nr:MAG: sugar transferase related protein [uncultured bacterium]
MNVSVCVTVFNEKAETIKKLLDALKVQTLKPDEIIIIDARDHNNCSRSRGRNIAIKKARNEIIAITDAGCIPHKDWLDRITKPFLKNETTVIAGGYRMIFENSFQRAESIFLGTKEENIDANFMPSARSMAFTKSIWKKAGGFPEKLGNTAEDTLFNIKLLKAGAKFIVTKTAIVDWQMPRTIYDFGFKIYEYAKGDAESGIWWHPIKRFQTHNLKILTIYLRYTLFIFFPWLILLYLIYAYTKAGLWGIILQLTSDIAGIIGFGHGLLQTSFKRT